jgi:hypothetical protein
VTTGRDSKLQKLFQRSTTVYAECGNEFTASTGDLRLIAVPPRNQLMALIASSGKMVGLAKAGSSEEALTLHALLQL